MQKIELAYIIDDDEIIMYLTDLLIKETDFCTSIEKFTDGLQALERLKQVIVNGGKLPDVILFDLNMPVMDGWEFVKEYLNLPLVEDIPLFVFTSSINPQDLHTSNGFNVIKGFIQKPLTVQKLTKIQRIIL